VRIYVAGPYGDHNPPEVIAENVRRADEAARELLVMGHLPFCPHKMTHHWEQDSRLTPSHYLTLDTDILLRWADALFRLPGESKGSDREEELARAFGMPVFYTYAEVEAAS